MEPFVERGLKGELDPIPCYLMKIDGETLAFAAVKPSPSLVFNGVLTIGKKREVRFDYKSTLIRVRHPSTIFHEFPTPKS